MYSLATDGSSDEEDMFFSIIITHEDVHTGLVTTSFIDMPVVNMATGENISLFCSSTQILFSNFTVRKHTPG
jgi:hypothetical protein